MSEKEAQDAAAAATAAAAAAKVEQDAAAAKAAAAAQGTEDPFKDLALPDGSPLDPALVGSVKEIAAKHSIPVEAAKALLESVNGGASELVRTLNEGALPDGAIWKAKVEADTKLSLADPDLGNGSARELEAKRLQAELYLNRTDPDLKDTLHKAGLLAHPTVLKYLVARVKERGEDKFIEGDRKPAPAAAPTLRDRYNKDGSPAVPLEKQVV